jgi:phosphatidylinositol alpha-1,6-mannosyltransferase
MSNAPKSLLITLEYPPDIGGVAEYYKTFVENVDSDISVFHIKPAPHRFWWMLYFHRVVREMRGLGAKYMFVGNILPLGYIALIIYWLFGKPYSVFVHGLDVLQKMPRAKRFFIRTILFFSKEVIANSKFTAKQVQKKYSVPGSKLRVVYPKINVARIENGAHTAPVITKSDSYILLTVGRLVARKGFDKVIEAIAFLNKRRETQNESSNARFEYWIIGEGGDRARLEHLAASLGVAGIVRFFGKVAVPDLYGYYKACDAFIMPSREIDGDVEGFGIVFLEAAVFKKPVVGGQSGGVSEAVIDGVTGILVDSLNVEEIAYAILRLSRDIALSYTLGEAGYKRVKREFNVS